MLAGDALNTNEWEEMNKLLDKWNNVLRDTPGHTNVLLHNVDTGQAPPIGSMPYQLPEVWKQPVKEEIWELLRLKIINHSTSPWSFPIVPIRKPGWKVRMCVDYRRLNSITNPDPYYMPLVDELLQKVGSSQVLSKLDLAKGFYQVGLTDEARARPAFVTPMGKIEFLRMPFGMRNAPSTFQQLMCLGNGDSRVLRTQDWKRTGCGARGQDKGYYQIPKATEAIRH